MSTPMHDSAGSTQQSHQFEVRDCALVAIATGKKAANLRELVDGIQAIDVDSIYYHFWGELLQPRFEEREYNNDFAGWARHSLHDGVLAERLAVLDPTDFPALEDLRQEMVDLVEERLDESEYLHWARATDPFEFIRSQIVVFDTHRRIERVEDLAGVIPHLSASSVYYHFIDARRRLADRTDDFRAWLDGFGELYQELRAELANIDPYFGSLTELRDQLSLAFSQHVSGGA